MSRDTGVIVVAAGRGVRFGAPVPKQFLPLGDSTVLGHAVGSFLGRGDVAQVVVVVPAAMVEESLDWLGRRQDIPVDLVAGGATRRESVAAGLAALSAACEVVLVHDGARPFPPADSISQCIAAGREGRATAVAVPVSDTIKRADDFGRIIGTVERAGLWHAQTPQGFPRLLLEEAHAASDNCGVGATDDAALVERIGGRVDLIPGSSANIKITTASDLEFAEWLVARR